MSRHDAVIAFSNSGETAELNDIILFASRHGIPITGVTKRGDSFLARHADYVLLLPNEPEACPIGCAPTTSTTLQMALGDAIALSLLKARGFGAEDFHRFHPGGRLGRKLMTVREIMHVGEALPLASLDSPMTEILCIMTGKGVRLCRHYGERHPCRHHYRRGSEAAYGRRAVGADRRTGS